jgi:hypothetical protein
MAYLRGPLKAAGAAGRLFEAAMAASFNGQRNEPALDERAPP